MLKFFKIPLTFVILSISVILNGQTANNNSANWTTIFSSGFEASEGSLKSDSNWSNTQIQNPFGTEAAFITFDSTIVHSGNRSLKMFAPERQYDSLRERDYCGKASVQKTNFLFREGETYRYSVWFYLTDPPGIANFLLIDIECGESECGPIAATGPGFRVIIRRGLGRLQAEWKFLNWFGSDHPPEHPPGDPVPGMHAIPVNEWFKVTLEATLGVDESGITSIYVNDEFDSEVVGTNIRPGGSLANMDRYNSFETGLTCNVGVIPTTIYIDDVTIEKLDTIATSVDDNIDELPQGIKLFQNYPNPFNPTTKIKYSIIPSQLSSYQGERLREGFVSLVVYDVLGREVNTLVNENIQPGSYEVEFNGSNLPSGIYFYRLVSGDFIQTKTMMLIK